MKHLFDTYSELREFLIETVMRFPPEHSAISAAVYVPGDIVGSNIVLFNLLLKYAKDGEFGVSTRICRKLMISALFINRYSDIKDVIDQKLDQRMRRYFVEICSSFIGINTKYIRDSGGRYLDYKTAVNERQLKEIIENNYLSEMLNSVVKSVTRLTERNRQKPSDVVILEIIRSEFSRIAQIIVGELNKLRKFDIYLCDLDPDAIRAIPWEERRYLTRIKGRL